MLEINIFKKNKTLETFYLGEDKKSFEFNNKKYLVDKKKSYYFFEGNRFFFSLFYIEGKPNPVSFLNKNNGIPARALNLLWDTKLYKVLVEYETDKTNLIIVILLLINLFLVGVRLYLLVKGGG